MSAIREAYKINKQFQVDWYSLRVELNAARTPEAWQAIKDRMDALEAERHEALKGASPIYQALQLVADMNGLRRQSTGVAGLPFRHGKIEKWEDIEAFDYADNTEAELSEFALLEAFQATYEAFKEGKP